MDPTSHDHNFKNLILDYPRPALAFFAPDEAQDIPPDAKITPIRQEQLKERLGDRFRELDTPLLVEFPNGEREAIIFVVEQETTPNPWSLYRHAIYCLSVAEMLKTKRVVAVAIHPFPGGNESASLTLGTERKRCLEFKCFVCRVSKLEAAKFLESLNVVERLCMPLMKHPKSLRMDVVSASVKGLMALEPDADRRKKYLGFVLGYSGLTPMELRELRVRHKNQEEIMSTLEVIQDEIAIRTILSLFQHGELTRERASESLKRMVTNGEISKKSLKEALKKLKI